MARLGALERWGGGGERREGKLTLVGEECMLMCTYMGDWDQRVAAMMMRVTQLLTKCCLLIMRLSADSSWVCLTGTASLDRLITDS